jgi:hypothetical protein
MTDIVDCLRSRPEHVQVFDHLDRPYGLDKSIEHEAADEIERLRAERDAAKADLELQRWGLAVTRKDRDRAMADGDRLRKALRAFLSADDHWLRGNKGGEWAVMMGYARAKARAALKETGHEADQ